MFSWIKNIIWPFCLLWSCLLLAAPTDSDLRVRSEIDRAKIELGDSVQLTVTVRSRAEYDYTIPPFENGIYGLRITDAKEEVTTAPPDWKVYRKIYRLESDLSGSYVIPPVVIQYRPKGQMNGAVQEIKTTELFLEVRGSSDASSDQNKPNEGLRDLKPLVRAEGHALWWILAGLLVLALLGGVLVYHHLRNKRQNQVATPIIPPGQKALMALDELLQRGDLEQNEIKQFHFTLSLIVRQYLEDQFSFPATDLTLEEIKRRREQLQPHLVRNEIDLILALLSRCDLVKFTDTAISNEESLELCQQAKQFVVRTSPSASTLLSSTDQSTEQQESVL